MPTSTQNCQTTNATTPGITSVCNVVSAGGWPGCLRISSLSCASDNPEINASMTTPNNRYTAASAVVVCTNRNDLPRPRNSR